MADGTSAYVCNKAEKHSINKTHEPQVKYRVEVTPEIMLTSLSNSIT